MDKALIFDLDGTLWDATEELCLVWNEIFRALGIGRTLTRDDLKGIMGKTIEETADMLFPNQKREYGLRVLSQCAESHIRYLEDHGANLYEGVEEVLKELSAEYSLYIVSNCPSGYIEAFLKAHHMAAYFNDYEMSGRTGKPKGENIRLIIERNRIRKSAYIGDTRSDESAARNANIPFIHAAYGFGTAEKPDAVIHSFKELSEVTNTLF